MKLNRFFVRPVFEAADDAGGTGGADDDGGGGDVQTLSFDWSGLSDDNKVYVENKKFTHEGNLNDIFDMGRNAEIALGKNNMAGPVDGKEADFWADNKERFGVGATPGDYKIDYGELPEGMAADEKLMSFLENTAHKHNMPSSFVHSLVAEFKEMRVAEYEGLEAKIAEEKKSLVDELTAKYGDSYQAKIVSAEAGLKALGLTIDDLDVIENISSDKFKALSSIIKLGELDAEGGYFGGDNTGGGAVGIEALENELNEFEVEHKDVLGNRNAPNRAEIVEKRSAMTRKLAQLRAKK